MYVPVKNSLLRWFRCKGKELPNLSVFFRLKNLSDTMKAVSARLKRFSNTLNYFPYDDFALEENRLQTTP